MQQDTDDKKVAAIREYQRHTMGTERYHFNVMFPGFKWTDGIQYVANVCGGQWLIDMVASHQPAIHGRLARLRLRDFQVWRLSRDENGVWIAEAWTDTPGEVWGHTRSKLLARQRFEYSDFPEGLLPFEFWVEGGVAMLKEER